MRAYSDILGSVDSAFYYVERLETPMNIGALAIFDGAIDYEALVRFIESRIHLSPRYQERIVQAPLNLGQPTWIRDPNFFVRDHIRIVPLDDPDNPTRLGELAGQLAAEPLDRNRPLWEVIYIEGLPGRTALLFKVHHCMVDGLAAVDLFTFMMDVTPNTKMPGRRYVKPAPTLPDPLSLLVDSVQRDLTHQFNMLRKVGSESMRILSTLTNSEERLNMLVAAVHLINDNLRPISKLPINGTNTGQQRLVWADFALDDIHAIRATRKASVNDVMLTIMARAVEHYVNERGGTEQPFLRALVPINIRTEEERGDYGNRISVLPMDIPFGVVDPLEQLAAVTHYTQVMKHSGLTYTMDMVLTIPSILPAVTHKPIWGLAPVAFALLAHTWCTNVAAMPIPVYLMGHELKHVYGFFPLNPSMGLASVIVSYNGRITLTMVADDGIVKDATVLGTYANIAFNELCRAAGVTSTPKPAPKAVEPPAPPAPPAATVTPPAVASAAAPVFPVAQTVPVAAPTAAVPPTAASPAAPPVPAPSAAPAEPAAAPPAVSAPEPVVTPVPPVDSLVVPAPSIAPTAESAAAPASAVVPVPVAVTAPTPMPDPSPSPVVQPMSNGSPNGHADEVTVSVAAMVDPASVIAAQTAASSNGAASAPVVAADRSENGSPAVPPPAAPAPAAPPVEEPAAKPKGFKLFSPEWADAMREAINASEAYRNASTGWTAGSLALVVEAAPQRGIDQPTGVLLDLYRGSCRGARSVSLSEATRLAAFVIQGSYDRWIDALDGRYAPLVMLTTGQLSLKKGLMLRLIPFTHSASELVHCAQRVPLSR